MKSNHNKISRIAIKLLHFFYYTIGTVFLLPFFIHLNLRWKDAGTIFSRFWRLCLLSSLSLDEMKQISLFAPYCALKYFMKMRACYHPIWMCFLFVKCSPSFWELIGVRFFSLFSQFFFSVGENWPCVSLESSWYTLLHYTNMKCYGGLQSMSGDVMMYVMRIQFGSVKQ